MSGLIRNIIVPLQRLENASKLSEEISSKIMEQASYRASVWGTEGFQAVNVWGYWYKQIYMYTYL